MVHDTSSLDAQNYKVCIKSEVEQSSGKSSAPLHLCGVAIEKEPSGCQLYFLVSHVFFTVELFCGLYIFISRSVSWCISYWKGSLRIIFDNSHQLFLILYIILQIELFCGLYIYLYLEVFLA